MRRRRPRPSFGVFPVVLTLVVLLLTVVASFVALSSRDYPINQKIPQQHQHLTSTQQQWWWNPFRKHTPAPAPAPAPTPAPKPSKNETDEDAKKSDDNSSKSTTTTPVDPPAPKSTPEPTPAPTKADACPDCTLEQCKPLMCDPDKVSTFSNTSNSNSISGSGFTGALLIVFMIWTP